MTKMTREDMLDVENAGLKLDVLRRQAEELSKHREEVFARYGVTADELASGITVDKDGTIKKN